MATTAYLRVSTGTQGPHPPAKAGLKGVHRQDCRRQPPTTALSRQGGYAHTLKGYSYTNLGGTLIEKVFVEFEDEDLAVSFEECVKDGTARIVLDEDTSINAAPKELQEEYELALVSGDEERLEGVLTVLWEEYGIHGENPPIRETSGIKHLAIMHDDGVNTFGFKGHPDILLEWMIENGFPLRNVNLALYD